MQQPDINYQSEVDKVPQNSSQQMICKNLDAPDETREFKGHGHLDLVNLTGDIQVGRATFEPGWKWSQDVKPLANTESCEASHTGYCINGRMIVRMNDGKEIHVKAGDAFYIPPGHDAWVEGDDLCVVLDFSGYSDYALSSKNEAKVTH